MSTEYTGLIKKMAKEFGVPSNLIEAIIQVESGGNTFAMRYEEGYSWLWNIETNKPHRRPSSGLPSPRMASQNTELVGQQTSWGLMQVMGAVAREYGFDRPFLCELVEPEIGLFYGCKHLHNLKKRFHNQHGWPGVAAAFNAGSPRMKNSGFINQRYVDKIEDFGGFIV
ncbi:MAG: transglycosylase SLT domain-containing protein [Actinobacteria bacterium]|nr:transglycosylase SLT domain-containing protein [Actinomycetota bacterium]